MGNLCCRSMLLAAGVLSLGRAAEPDFARDIQPVFQQSCYGCHGPKAQMGGLRLDSASAAQRIVQPGKPLESVLFRRITGAGDQAQMPLGGKPLDAGTIARIKVWIEAGAPWPASAPAIKHWAFVAPVRPAIPESSGSWVRTPIDAFILQALTAHRLNPSQEAAKATLLRRLSLDLTGLPPRIEETRAYLADSRADAYERQVDRLLASSHYGERWGRHWLDVARYADTNGFEKDLPRSIWSYRDWVIQALNRDMPFSQFATEQLAGDLLPNASVEQKTATGFLRNSMLNEEGAVDPEQFRVEGVIDRVDAVGKAFLGLTVNCAQCHSHKFDPISHQEYYRFYSFLNSDDEPSLEVPNAKILEKRSQILASIQQIQNETKRLIPDWDVQLQAWAKQRSRTQWTILEGGTITASFGTKFDSLEDHSFLAKGDNSTGNRYVVKSGTPLARITGFRLELMTDPNLPRGGPGRASDGGVYLSEFTVDAGPAGKPDAKKRVIFSSATADFSAPDFPVSNAIDGNPKTAWGIDAGPGRRNQDREAVFTLKDPLLLEAGAELTVELSQKTDASIGRAPGDPNLGRFRLAVTSDDAPVAHSVPPGILRLLAIPESERTAQQQEEIFAAWQASRPEFAEATRQITALMKEWPYGPVSLALSQRPHPRATHLFKRGDWRSLGETVTPGTPAALHAFPAGAPRNRLGLAQWIVAPDNPLTARVIVNRIWQQYFGVGLVTTPEDFGSRCEKPSHPELLDWLAVEFRESGWRMKHLHKLIVMSATYRQSSQATPEGIDADPTNRWLSRAPRLRVEAETIRDIALSASGLLSDKIGGPSVYPPIPDGVLSLSFGSPMKWETATGPDRYRRGMYVFWKRTAPYPSLSVFDAPNADAACTRRVRSNTPLQALTTLNDQTFMEAAQAMALRIWKQGGADDRSRMRFAFQLCLNRDPETSEMDRMLAFLRKQAERFDGNTAASVYVTSADLNNIPPGLDLHLVAPWTMVSRVLLNLDETMTKE